MRGAGINGFATTFTDRLFAYFGCVPPRKEVLYVTLDVFVMFVEDNPFRRNLQQAAVAAAFFLVSAGDHLLAGDQIFTIRLA